MVVVPIVFDAEKVKRDKRLPFGLPAVNKTKTVSNANCLWLSHPACAAVTFPQR
jgi:hypothetical protein